MLAKCAQVGVPSAHTRSMTYYHVAKLHPSSKHTNIAAPGNREQWTMALTHCTAATTTNQLRKFKGLCNVIYEENQSAGSASVCAEWSW